MMCMWCLFLKSKTICNNEVIETENDYSNTEFNLENNVMHFVLTWSFFFNVSLLPSIYIQTSTFILLLSRKIDHRESLFRPCVTVLNTFFFIFFHCSSKQLDRLTYVLHPQFVLAMLMSAGCLIHHVGRDWNVSPTVGWTAMTVGSDI